MAPRRRHRAARFAAVALGLLLAGGAAHAAEDGTILGRWLTKGGKSQIEIAECGEALCGTIVWLKPRDDGGTGPLLDTENSDPVLRSRPLLGLRMMTGFQPTGPGEWGDGELYNPDDGDVYKPSLKLNGGGELEVTGCVLFFCETHTWTRVP